MGFQENFKAIRKEKGMSQTWIADKLHVTPQAISSWEMGRTSPNYPTLESIATLFGCSVSDLIGGSTVTMDASTFSAFTSKVNTSSLSEDEQLILDTYRSLSQIGKMKLYAYMESLK